MPQFKNHLDELLAEIVLASGVDRNIFINQVRQYIEANTTDKIRTEIAQITSLQELQVLQAVGVRRDLQDIFLSTYGRLGNRLGV